MQRPAPARVWGQAGVQSSGREGGGGSRDRTGQVGQRDKVIMFFNNK